MANPPERHEAGRDAPGEGVPVRSELLREVNERIREVGRDGHGAALEFVCECGGGECVSLVQLTFGEYDGIRLGTGLVLAADHAPA